MTKARRGPRHTHRRDIEKQNEADARQKARDARTPAQQLVLIDSRPGESKRERARLTGNGEFGKAVGKSGKIDMKKAVEAF